MHCGGFGRLPQLPALRRRRTPLLRRVRAVATEPRPSTSSPRSKPRRRNDISDTVSSRLARLRWSRPCFLLPRPLPLATLLRRPFFACGRRRGSERCPRRSSGCASRWRKTSSSPRSCAASAARTSATSSSPTRTSAFDSSRYARQHPHPLQCDSLLYSSTELDHSECLALRPIENSGTIPSFWP
jgi:hypothetical protein